MEQKNKTIEEIKKEYKQKFKFLFDEMLDEINNNKIDIDDVIIKFYTDEYGNAIDLKFIL